MKLIYDTPNGFNLSPEGILRYGNQNLIEVPNFKGFILDRLPQISTKLPLRHVVSENVPITGDLMKRIDSFMESAVETLTKCSDYVPVDDGFEMPAGTVLHMYSDFTDMFQDIVCIGYTQSQDPSGSINLAMSEPYTIAPDSWILNIPRKYQLDWTYLSSDIIPESDFEVFVRYAEYDIVGTRLRTKTLRSRLSDFVGGQVEIPKVQDRLNKIEYILLIYSPE